MDIKAWAKSKLGGAPGDAVSASGRPRAATAMALFNPGITADALPPAMASWAQAGGTQEEHPQGTPPWAEDSAAYQHALALVKRDWDAYKEPWAAVATAYDAMKSAAPKPAFPSAAGGAPAAMPRAATLPGFGKPAGPT